VKQLSEKQKERNKKSYRYENLRVSAEEARARLADLAKVLLSKDFTTRQKIDMYVKISKEICTDNISILKSPAKMTGFVYRPIFGSEIAFNTDHKRETLQIWIPFSEWDKLGDDFEEVYKECIDWELIARHDDR